MTKAIGAMATIRWSGEEKTEGEHYFSFEKFPEGADVDTFVLPLAQIPDEQVFMYCNDEAQFLKMAGNTGVGDFDIVSYVLVTPSCDAVA
jgi:hypothetical protein